MINDEYHSSDWDLPEHLKGEAYLAYYPVILGFFADFPHILY